MAGDVISAVPVYPADHAEYDAIVSRLTQLAHKAINPDVWPFVTRGHVSVSLRFGHADNAEMPFVKD